MGRVVSTDKRMGRGERGGKEQQKGMYTVEDLRGHKSSVVIIKA